MGVDQVSKHDHSTDAAGGDAIAPAVFTGRSWTLAHIFDLGPDEEINPWVKDAANPVLTPAAASEWDADETKNMGMIREGGTYKLAYGAAPNEAIGIARSPDLVSWTKDANNPVISPGAASEWDEDLAVEPHLMKVGDTYHIFYTGVSGGVAQIGHATSTDLVTWTKDANNPVLTTGAASEWDADDVAQSHVMLVGDTFEMFYKGQPNNEIGRATSDGDLSSWTKDAANPILTKGAASEWDENGLNFPSLWKTGSTYHMMYTGTGTGVPLSIGRATASADDLTTWTKDANNPVISPGAASEWDDAALRRIVYFQVGNTFEAIYEGDNGPTRQIGHVSLDVSPPT